MNNLAKSAMLVSVAISNGGLLGERRDRKASDLVENTYDVSHGRAKASKYLIDRKHKSVKAVIAASQRVREIVYRYTMPWGTDTQRLLPVRLHKEFDYEAQKALGELEQARKAYIRDYPGLVQASEAELGELFCAGEYPPQNEVERYFTSKITYWPLPESGHFLADISKEAAKSAKEAIENEVEERLIEATYDMVRRAKDVVSAFLTKLERTDVTVTPPADHWGRDEHKINGVLRDSLIDNIKNTASLIEKMNLTGNLQIKKVIQDLSRLTDYSADYWRRKPEQYLKERPEAMNVAKEIMVNLEMLDLKDKEIESMVADASEYM